MIPVMRYSIKVFSLRATVIREENDLAVAAAACRAARRDGQAAVLWDAVANKAISLRGMGI